MEVQLVNTEVQAYLTIFTDGVPGDKIPLTSELVTVGRFACDVTVEDANISRNHCSLKRRGKNWILTDLKSLNGTYFGNKRLKPKVSYPLRNGIMFSIGPPQPTTVTAHTTFLFTCEEDKEQKMLKRKFDEQNSDEAMQDSQRTAVPSISPSLDGDDGVSDSSVSSTDSLKTRIRKLSAANRKKKESSENNWRVPSTSKLGFDFQRNPHLMRPILIKYGPETPKARYEAIDESKISFERFRILDTLCNEPDSPMKTVNEDKEAAVQLVNEVEKTRIKALEEELEMLKAQVRMQQSEELEKLLEHFACIICAEIIDEPMVLNCSHSMCKYCLLKWKKKQNRCPICREKIVYEVKNLLLRNFIDKTVEGMDDEFQANRRKLVSDRQTEIALWLLKKKKRMFRRSFKRRISRRIALNHPGEGPRNFGEGTISVRLSTYDSE